MEVKEQGSEGEKAIYFLNIRMLTINAESFSHNFLDFFLIVQSYHQLKYKKYLV